MNLVFVGSFVSKGAAVNEHVYCLGYECPCMPVNIQFLYHILYFTDGLSVVLFFFFLLRFDLAFLFLFSCDSMYCTWQICFFYPDTRIG